MSEDRDAPFSRRALGWLIGVAAVSFLTAIAVSIFGHELGGETVSAGADSYSRSALGHRGFVELLEAEGMRVVRSQHDSGARAGENALLVIAEPRLGDDEGKQALRDELDKARHVVLVLPKRTGFKDPLHPGWITDVELRPLADAQEVLDAAGIADKVARPGPDATLHGEQIDDVQLVGAAGDDTEILAESPAGALVARYPRDHHAEVIVISDPDLIANHGLARGSNASVALAAIEAARPAGGVVVVDETLHGHVTAPSLWRELFTFPLALASCSVLLVLALLLWSAMGRFGKPRPEPRALGAGKRFLIDNTAELTRLGGHSTHALERYLHASVQEVARAQHAPAQLGPSELRAWLAHAARARKVSTDLGALEREVAELSSTPGKPGTAARALAAAARIHRWRQEMIDGSAGHSRAS